MVVERRGERLWKTDAGYFGIKVDEAAQKHELLHQPWEFGADLARTVVHQLWDWMHTLVTVGRASPRVRRSWPCSGSPSTASPRCCATAREAPIPLGWLHRALVLVVFCTGCLLVAIPNYLYWTEPGSSDVGGIQPRYFMPLVVLIPVAIGSLPFRWADAARARFPVPVLLVPTLLVFCVILTFHMY